MCIYMCIYIYIYRCLTCRDYDLVDLWWDLLLSRSAVSNSVTPWTAARQASLSFTISWNLLKLMSVESVMPSHIHLILCHPLLFCLQSFLASGSFIMRQLFSLGGQSFGASASASVLPMNIQGWFPLGLTGLIPLWSKGLSRVFSSTAVWKHRFWYQEICFSVSGSATVWMLWGGKCYHR